MEKDLCAQCGECCKNIKADLNAKILYWDGQQELTEDFASMLIPQDNTENLFTCKYLKNNLCTNTNKPKICLDYPSTPFTEIPADCSYSAELFISREKIQQKIRKFKEEIIHYNALIPTIKSKKEITELKRIILTYEKQILRYKQYGSENW